jgi:Flp pilus assembly protein TadG
MKAIEEQAMKTIRDQMELLSRKARAFGAFWRDRKGTGAIEFAIIAPLLIMAYIGSFETSLGFSIARKVSRASSTVADILTQQPEVDKAMLDGMRDVAKSIMAPYEMTTYTLKVTGIKMTAPGVGIVAWSRDQNAGTPYKAGSIATIPNDIPVANTFIVRSELVVPHELLLFAPGLAKNTLKTINLSKTYYFRQRLGTEITCKDCGS